VRNDARVIESLAAVAFYVGLAAFIYGLVRVTTASIERHSVRDTLGIASIALGVVLFTIAVLIYLHSPKSILPF
jgi:uncharacterized membrane protein HdeD (DUF308 family)